MSNEIPELYQSSFNSTEPTQASFSDNDFETEFVTFHQSHFTQNETLLKDIGHAPVLSDPTTIDANYWYGNDGGARVGGQVALEAIVPIERPSTYDPWPPHHLIHREAASAKGKIVLLILFDKGADMEKDPGP